MKGRCLDRLTNGPYLIGCGGRTRTCDLRVMSPTSCQLLHPAILIINGAEDRNRTGTGGKSRRILSPVRLPVPPLRHITWLRLTLPGSYPPSTISAKELNFCVRYGNRCILFAIITTYCIVFIFNTSIILILIFVIVNTFFNIFIFYISTKKFRVNTLKTANI